MMKTSIPKELENNAVCDENVREVVKMQLAIRTLNRALRPELRKHQVRVAC